MTTADYALLISLASALISIFALVWNVWQKYIFVKPDLQVTFSVMNMMTANPAKPNMLRMGKQLLALGVTNMGPGPVTLYMCCVRMKRSWWRFWKKGPLGLLNPIHDVSAAVASSTGPFSGGLPVKIDAGEMKSFFFPYDKDCVLNQPIVRVGMNDTYRRISWCRRSDTRKAMASFKRDFPNAKPTPISPAEEP